VELTRDIKNTPREFSEPRYQLNEQQWNGTIQRKIETHVWGSGDTTCCLLVCPSIILISFMYSLATTTVDEVAAAAKAKKRGVANFMVEQLATMTMTMAMIN